MIEGYEAPIIGRVSMDLTVIDVSKIPDNLISLGQNVEILGAHLTADKIAKVGATNGYEILTSLGSRYERIYS
jgi:alanine racemase